MLTNIQPEMLYDVNLQINTSKLIYRLSVAKNNVHIETSTDIQGSKVL